MTVVPASTEEIIADIDNGLWVEDEGFAELIVGSTVRLDDIRRKSYGGWYLSAAPAQGTWPCRRLGLGRIGAKPWQPSKWLSWPGLRNRRHTPRRGAATRSG